MVNKKRKDKFKKFLQGKVRTAYDGKQKWNRVEQMDIADT